MSSSSRLLIIIGLLCAACHIGRDSVDRAETPAHTTVEQPATVVIEPVEAAAPEVTRGEYTEALTTPEPEDKRAIEAAADDAAPPADPVKYLLVGDSMAWALGVELSPMMKEDGNKFIFKSKISGSIRGFSSKRGKAVRDQVVRYNPDAVIIVLGTNESLIPNPSVLERPIRRVVDAVGERECYWIGPPMWREDTGIVELLSRAATPCHFFNSSNLELDRRPDKIHPSRKGSRTWAAAVRGFIKRHPPKPRMAMSKP